MYPVPLDHEILLTTALLVEYDATWWDEPSEDRETLRDLPEARKAATSDPHDQT
jgi:hypothetical protein